MQYTLTWKVDKTVSTGCPDYRPDPYTGEYPTTHCAVYHFETITENRSRDFETEEEVTEFAKKAPLSCYEFKINGKLIEDTRERPKYSNITISETSLIDGTGTTTLEIYENLA